MANYNEEGQPIVAGHNAGRFVNGVYQNPYSDPAKRAEYDAMVKQRWEDIQTNKNGWYGSQSSFDRFLGKTMDKLPMIYAVAATVALAGAGASALNGAAAAGETAAAAAAEAGWAGIASEAVAGVNAAGISGGAISSALAGAMPAVNAAVTGAAATVAAASPAAAATIAGTIEASSIVTITGTKAVTALPALVGAGAVGAAGLAATAAGGEGVAVAESALPPVEVPPLNHAPVVTPGELAAGAAGGAGVGGIIDKIGSVAGVVGGLLDPKTGALGALTGPALAAALAGLTSEKMPENAQLNGSIDKLTSNADKQMAEWNDWMFPKLKGALADNKTATDDFVGKANANAGQLEGMGASARGLGDLYAQRNRDVYIPLADKIIADANKFNKEGFGEQQAGLAIGDLASAYAAQRLQQSQDRARYGVDPSSGRALAIDAAGGITQAAGSAAAATRARMAAEELWGKKQVDALNTSAALNANANTINSSYTTAGGLYSGATGLRQQGVKATSDYFTNASDLAKTSTGVYNSSNNALGAAGQLGLGKSKIEGDRYIAEQQGRGQVIGAGLQGMNQNGGIVKTVGDTIGAVGKVWNALKGIWE